MGTAGFGAGSKGSSRHWVSERVAGCGANGAALSTPTPLVSADMPTPAAIAAAAVNRFIFIFACASPDITTLVTSCLVGYAENHQQRTRRYRLAVNIS
jgi:hypothetical protein